MRVKHGEGVRYQPRVDTDVEDTWVPAVITNTDEDDTAFETYAEALDAGTAFMEEQAIDDHMDMLYIAMIFPVTKIFPYG